MVYHPKMNHSDCVIAKLVWSIIMVLFCEWGTESVLSGTMVVLDEFLSCKKKHSFFIMPIDLGGRGQNFRHSRKRDYQFVLQESRGSSGKTPHLGGTLWLGLISSGAGYFTPIAGHWCWLLAGTSAETVGQGQPQGASPAQWLDSKNESSKRQDVETDSIWSFDTITLAKFCLLRQFQRATRIQGRGHRPTTWEETDAISQCKKII